ncbi:MAG: SPOR domain-containing protein [Pseudomonadota bacterium]
MDGFKQRIIGALIIVSLAVIFLPMLFDEPHQQRRERILEVPPEPEMEPVEVEAPREPEVPEDSEGPDIPMADEGEVESEGEVEREEEPVTTLDKPEPTPEVDQEETGPLKGAYLVRLGSFGSRDNAVRLRDRVREQGMDAHTETVDNDGESFTRVFAGPFSAEDDAEKARKKLESDFNLEAMVVEGED